MGNLKSCCREEEIAEERKIESMGQPLPEVKESLKQQPELKPNRSPPQAYFQLIENILDLQEKIIQYKANDRKFKQAVKVNIKPIQTNRLNDVYYVKQMDAFYIGEWAFDNRMSISKEDGENLPTGIGKLYEKEYISEGQLQTTVTEGQTLYQIRVALEGRGRKFNKNELMDGEFRHGKLHGTGVYKNKKEEYIYQGLWQQGFRYGRGIQKTKKYTYSGQFVKDKRQGKGMLTFLLSTAQKIRLQQQDKRVQEHFKREEARMDESEKQRRKKNKQDKQKVKATVQKILSEKSKWQNPFKEKSLFQNEIFYKQRLVRGLFEQVYTGDFNKDQFHGEGMYTWHSGKVYKGSWRNGKFQGLGEFIWPNNVCYRGQYRNDQKHGLGELIWNQNVRWRGTWAYGMRHGYGESVEINTVDQTIRIKGAKWDRDKEVKLYFKKIYQFTGNEESWKTQITEKDSNQIEKQRAIREESDEEYQLPKPKRVMEIAIDEPNKKSSNQESILRSDVRRVNMSTAKTTSRTWMRPNFFENS